MAQIKFGTDGWRAVIAEDYTFDNVRIVSQAVAEWLKSIGRDKDGVAVGYDTRFGSENFASATAEVLAANGIRVYMSDSFLPTPALSYAIIQKKAGAGVMITASHNPPADNGYKVKPYYGGSASPDIITEIESRLGQSEVKRITLAEATKQGLFEKFDAFPAYLEQLGRMVDLQAIRDSNLDIIVDSMYGAGQGYYSRILGNSKASLAQLNGERNPAFPGIHNPEPIAKNLEKLMQFMQDTSSDLGIANDGDADRVGIVDENGRFVNQLEVFALLALYLLEVKGERGMIVKSLSTTSMVDKLGALYNVPVFETPVGFKYIGPKMMAENAIIGGEESGGFGFRGHIPERDGILSGLMIAEMMIKLNLSASGLLAHLFEKVGPHYYDRIDFTFEQNQRNQIFERIKSSPPKDLAGDKVVKIRDDDGFKYYSEDGSWLLIRFSGTEPIMRVYAETTTPDKVQKFLEQGRALTGV
jgi:alpha-D-glucose phosphate-specific phosphoglucomutase